MIVPLYLLSLGLSSSLTGLLFRRLIAAQGLAPDLETGIMAAAVLALLFMSLQLAFMTIVQFTVPTHGKGLYFWESISQLTSLVMLPYLLGVQIPWPIDKLAEVEAFIFLAAFLGLHVLVKLLSLFSATQAKPAQRLWGFVWLAACCALLLCGFGVYDRWRAALNEYTFLAAGEEAPYQINTAHTLARPLTEGAVHPVPIHWDAARNLVFQWGPAPREAGEDTPEVDVIHVRFRFNDPKRSTIREQVELSPKTWAESSLSARQIPENADQCEVSWFRKEEPLWVEKTGLRPVRRSRDAVLLAGPYRPMHNQASSQPNLVLIAIEGVSGENISLLGYDRNTTPMLDAFAREGSYFENAYTTAPECAAACMTLLTGLPPLVHGYLEDYQGPLPQDTMTLPELLRDAGYATAAFTEGLGPDGEDLVYGNGFERGFDLFDDFYPSVPLDAATRPGSAPKVAPKGSAITLTKALTWMEKHKDRKFFIFIRLRELREPYRLRRYGEGFMGRGRTPTPRDIFDTALMSVDDSLGVYLEGLKRLPELSNTCVMLTAPYGLDFSEPGRADWRRDGKPKRTLHERSLRVPLCLWGPDVPMRQQRRLASLVDVAPTLLKLADLSFPYPTHGDDLMALHAEKYPISVQGNPLKLSIRSPQWRFTWQSGEETFGKRKMGTPNILQFQNVSKFRNNQLESNQVSRNPETVSNLRNRLIRYKKEYTPDSEAQ